MKTFLVAFLIPIVALSAPSEIMMRGSSGQPTSTTIARGGPESDAIVSNLHGDYYEGARGGTTYNLTTSGASDSFTTAGTSPVGAAGVAWLALYNPTTVVNFEILTISINTISGTPGAGGVQYNVACPGVALSGSNATPVSSKDGSPGRGLGFSQAALTGLPASIAKVVGQSAHVPFAAAVAATTPGINTFEEIKGRYIVGPGCVFAIAPVNAGTAWLGNGSLTFRESSP